MGFLKNQIGKLVDNIDESINGRYKYNGSSAMPQSGNLMNDMESDMKYHLEVPNWGIKNYIYERTSWQKQLDSFLDEPGWFYFKIFFKFNTNYGLLGGIMTDTGEGSSNAFASKHTALQYLMNNIGRLRSSHIDDRIYALGKFVCMLSFINCKAPWFFYGVSGLDKAYAPSMSELSKKKELELQFMPEAVDMRITTLFDLYKYACYDYVNMKEVIPENLRKFDMSIVLYHTPIRYYHTGVMLENGTFEYKSLNGGENDFGNRMSFKMFTFLNCEFNLESLSSTIQNEVKNDNPFNLGPAKIIINYDRVYQHNMNEWNEIMFGDTGFLWDGSGSKTNSQRDRMKGLMMADKNRYYFNNTATFYKSMVDASEAMINDNMRSMNPADAFGNMYGDYGVGSEYFNNKMKNLKHGTLK